MVLMTLCIFETLIQTVLLYQLVICTRRNEEIYSTAVHFADTFLSLIVWIWIIKRTEWRLEKHYTRLCYRIVYVRNCIPYRIRSRILNSPVKQKQLLPIRRWPLYIWDILKYIASL